MRRIVVVLAIALSMLAAMTVPVGAALLQDAQQGTMCDGGFATLHFVNNKTEGTQDKGTLVAVFAGEVQVVMANKVNRNVQHFDVVSDGSDTLISAATNLPGMLVLSDFTCRGKKDKK